jgi:hypothetical protein
MATTVSRAFMAYIIVKPIVPDSQKSGLEKRAKKKNGAANSF